jgi:hypothetical protein
MGQLPTVAVNLSPKQSQAFRALEISPDVTELFYGGAAGGGKSMLGCIWQIYRRLTYPGTRGLIGRNDYVSLRDTTLNTFFDLWNIYGAPTGIIGKYNGQDKSFKMSNGSEILFRHLSFEPGDPDFHRFGSLEITDAFVDELPEVSLKAWEVIQSRIRYKLDQLPVKKAKALACGNPANNWVKWRFVLDKQNKPIELKEHQRFIAATLDDNPNEEFREIYGDNLSKMSNYDQLRLRFGDWTATEQNGMEFYSDFKVADHVKELHINWALPFHISFDFNVNPYITMTIWQIEQTESGLILNAVDEICPEHPNNKTDALCSLFLTKYGDKLKQGGRGVFYYGDPSGKNNDTRGDNDYLIVEKTLRGVLNNNSARVAKNHPPVSKRRDFINRIFAGKMPTVKIQVANNCYNLVNDLSGTKQDVNGGKLKAKERNPITGQQYEKVGHTSDSMDYFICEVLKHEFNEFRGK